MPWACARRNCAQDGPARRGAGSIRHDEGSSRPWRPRAGCRVRRVRRERGGIPVRSTRGALPVLPLVGFPEPPPAPAVPVSGQRALHKPRHGSCGSSSRGRPRSRGRCSPVSVARGAHLRRVEQLSFLRARPVGCQKPGLGPSRRPAPRRAAHGHADRQQRPRRHRDCYSDCSETYAAGTTRRWPGRRSGRGRRRGPSPSADRRRPARPASRRAGWSSAPVRVEYGITIWISGRPHRGSTPATDQR